MSWFRFARAVLRREHAVAPLTWGSLIFAAVYTVWPLDLVPDWVFPIVGFADDAGFWAIFLLIAAREKNRWDASLNASAVDVEGRDKGA